MTGGQPTIDIVIPYHGARSLLEEAVSSVRAQTSPAWRLVVVEDGDQGLHVGEWLTGLQDPRIQHVLNERNLGIAGNFQRCLDLARAELVVFLGCDDRLLPTYVEQVTAGARAHPTAAGVLPGVLVIDEYGRPQRPLGDRLKARLRPRSTTSSGEELLRSLAFGNWTYFPATAWRRDVVACHGFRQDLSITLDLALLAALVVQGHEFVVGHEPVFEYRRHRASASSRAMVDTTRLHEERLVHAMMSEQARQKGWSRARRAARLRLTSRLHAVLMVPRSLHRPSVLGPLGRHCLGP